MWGKCKPKDLEDTKYAQPLMFIAGLAHAELMKQKHPTMFLKAKGHCWIFPWRGENSFIHVMMCFVNIGPCTVLIFLMTDYSAGICQCHFFDGFPKISPNSCKRNVKLQRWLHVQHCWLTTQYH